MDTVASPIPHRVLLLENHPLLRESLPALLHEQMPGLAMEQCSSVYGAIELLPRRTYDLVIFNVRMAGLSHFFLQHKHLSLHPLTPLIA